MPTCPHASPLLAVALPAALPCAACWLAGMACLKLALRSCLVWAAGPQGGSLEAESLAAAMDAFESSMASAAAGAAPKPRILVCAPSNAATDEVLERILGQGFYDGKGGLYRPAVLRVGSEDAPLSAEVKKVWTEDIIQ